MDHKVDYSCVSHTRYTCHDLELLMATVENFILGKGVLKMEEAVCAEDS